MVSRKFAGSMPFNTVKGSPGARQASQESTRSVSPSSSPRACAFSPWMRPGASGENRKRSCPWAATVFFPPRARAGLVALLALERELVEVVEACSDAAVSRLPASCLVISDSSR